MSPAGAKVGLTCWECIFCKRLRGAYPGMLNCIMKLADRTTVGSLFAKRAMIHRKGKSMLFRYLVGLVVLLIGATPAMADNIFDYPINWRLQNYVSDNRVVVFFTGVQNCPSGELSLSNATDAQKDRFWSIVMTAKITNKRVGIFYTGCVIDSFYLEN